MLHASIYGLIGYPPSLPPIPTLSTLPLHRSYDGYGLSSSQSIDLTFHSVSLPSHNRLTVDTVMTTQNEPSHSQRSEDETFFSREEPTRYFSACRLYDIEHFRLLRYTIV